MGLFKRDPDPVKLTSEGNYCGERENFDRAILCFQRAIAADAKHVPAYLGISTAYREKGDYEKAIKILESAPKESQVGGESFMDFSFQIAFQKVSVLVARHQRGGGQGDTSDLVQALQEAVPRQYCIRPRIGRLLAHYGVESACFSQIASAAVSPRRPK